jgi:uncharacterized membrane protein YhaH (DUF805 family)
MYRNIFSFKGRIRRTEFWISFIFIGIYNAWARDCNYQSMEFSFFWRWVITIVQVISFYIAISQGVKRCHDIGLSGWFAFIPFLNIILFFKGGEIETNAYGG